MSRRPAVRVLRPVEPKPRPTRRRPARIRRRSRLQMTNPSTEPTTRDAPLDDESSEGERHARQLIELLNELRIAIPGVQVLFAFLLVVPFSARFNTITAFQR